MAVHETKKQTDLEKRLKILRQSLSVVEPKENKIHVQTDTIQSVTRTFQASIATISDVSYLRRDLLKIVIFSTLAFAVQAGIFFGLQRNFIKIPNF